MIQEEKAKFKNMLDTVMAIYGKPSPDADTIKVWWMKLSKYDFNIVSKAFNTYIEKYKVMPNISSILDLCKVNPIRDYVPLQYKHDPEKMEANRKKFQEYMATFNQDINNDPKRWAKKIMENTDKYPDIAIKYAKEALHIRD